MQADENQEKDTLQPSVRRGGARRDGKHGHREESHEGGDAETSRASTTKHHEGVKGSPPKSVEPRRGDG